jgi:Calpain family cysteine protease
MEVIDLLCSDDDDNDDDDDEKESKNGLANNDNNGDSNNDDEALLLLRTLRAVLPHQTDRQLQKLLARAHGNLERAVDLAFQLNEAAAEEEEPVTIQQARRALRLEQPRSESTTDEVENAVVSFQQNNNNNKAINNDECCGVPFSEEWHRIIQSLSVSRNVWKDPDFPPISQSIDGRSLSGSSTEMMAAKKQEGDDVTVLLCHCGHPAASKKVQSDGPNYGRFYNSCGRRPPPKRRASVLAVCANVKIPTTNDGDDNDDDVRCSLSQQVLPDNSKKRSIDNNNHDDDDGDDPSPKKSAIAAMIIHNPYAKTRPPEKNPAAPVTTPATKQSNQTNNNNNNMGAPKAPPSPQHSRNCTFFQWDNTNGAINQQQYVTTGSRFTWQHFGHSSLETGGGGPYVLYKKRQLFHHASVRQGAVGNCWFLSALAVVAEQYHLIQHIMPHVELNQAGCYQINLFLDGQWTPILVDAYLPTVVPSSSSSMSRAKTKRKMMPTTRTAFCDVFEGQLWAPLVEKAYAKAHGSYQQLSGGFIQEALQDLTGAPTETILFPGPGTESLLLLDRDELWARLESFASAGFLMGVATAVGGDGLVGMHAYSVLEVLTLDNCAVGQQAKMTEYFGKQEEFIRPRRVVVEKTMVRLVRIRNPWGKREWNGAWSAHSEQWTKSIRSRLGTTSTYAKGDGTFYISYDDMLQRFHHLDVAKTRAGWTHSVADGVFTNKSSDPLASSQFAYFFQAPDETISATLSVIQPKKRAHTDTTFWYCDPSFILLKRRRSNRGSSSWERAACVVSGILRQSHIDIMVEKGTEYCCIPFSCAACLSHGSHYPFRLVLYSSTRMDVVAQDNHDSSLHEAALVAYHQHQLSSDLKLLYPAQPKALLACVHGTSCVTFIAINGYTDRLFSVKLMLVDLPKGLLVTFGREESDLPPQTQAVCLVVSTNGRQSAATEFSFRYLSTVTEAAVQTSGLAAESTTHHHRPLLYQQQQHQFGSKLKLGVAGDLLATSIESQSCRASGGDQVDTYLWIPQLGASSLSSSR